MEGSGSSKEFWTKNADLIDVTRFPRELRNYLESEEERIIRYCKDKKPGVVLEAGCGRGRVIEKILPYCGRVIGVDYSHAMIKVCSDKFRDEPGVELFEEDISQMHFEDNLFDAVILAFNTLGNIDTGKEKVLLEVKRVMKPDGDLLISVYSESAGAFQQKYYRDVGLNISKEENGTIYTKEGLVSQRFSKEELYAWLKVCGLKGEVEPLTDIGYFVVARKE